QAGGCRITALVSQGAISYSPRRLSAGRFLGRLLHFGKEATMFVRPLAVFAFVLLAAASALGQPAVQRLPESRPRDAWQPSGESARAATAEPAAAPATRNVANEIVDGRASRQPIARVRTGSAT